MAEMWKKEAGGFFIAWMLIGIFVHMKNLEALGLQQQRWDQAGFGVGEMWMEKAMVWGVVASPCVLKRFGW